MAMGWGKRLAGFGLVVLLTACGGGANQPQGKPAPGTVVTEEFMISSKEKDIELFLRNKHPFDYYSPKPEQTVLFVHGAAFPGSATFDLPVEGTSWMEWMAKRGFDVYSVDLRGYGKSGRPPAMNQPAESNPPQVDTAAAVQDVSKAVDFILSRRSIDRLVLVGWSWGASVAGSYTAQKGRVERLVLVSPQWLRDQAPPAELRAQLGAWRNLPLNSVKDRWTKEVTEKDRRDLVPSGLVESWLNALKAYDPEGAKQNPPVMKVPNGAVAEIFDNWSAGKPVWNPARVSVPTMVVQGEWDVETPPDMGLNVFAQLTGTAQRRYVLLGGGTHTMMLEKNRQHLYRAVQGFLEEKF